MKNTIRNRLFLALFISLVSVAVLESVVCGDLLLAPRAGLLDDLVKAGVKHTPEDIIDIRRLADGSIVFLEKGNARAGLQHIIQRHVDDFARKGISEAQIPNAIFEALTKGKVVGTSGTGRNVRSIYEFIFNGQTHRIGIGIADNGFIVTAFPK